MLWEVCTNHSRVSSARSAHTSRDSPIANVRTVAHRLPRVIAEIFSASLPPRVQHFVHDLEEARLAGKVVVHEVDQVVRVAHVRDEPVRRRVTVVQLGPFLAPQTKRLVLLQTQNNTYKTVSISFHANHHFWLLFLVL